MKYMHVLLYFIFIFPLFYLLIFCTYLNTYALWDCTNLPKFWHKEFIIIDDEYYHFFNMSLGQAKSNIFC